MSPEPPDLMGDPIALILYQEMIACLSCDGAGEGVLEDDGDAWVCPRCGGTGVDPVYEVYVEDES